MGMDAYKGLTRKRKELKASTAAVSIDRTALVCGASRPRSREIVMRRWLGERRLTLQELGQQYGVSAERVRQLESAALRRLKACIAGL